MSDLWPLVYLALCIVASCQWLPHAMRTSNPYDPNALVVWIFFIVAFFFGGFLLLGAIELACGLRWVDVEHAVYVMLIVALAGAVHGRTAWAIPRIACREHLECGTTRWLWLLVGLAYVVIMGVTAAQFPKGFEAVAYHLPSAVSMLKSASIAAWDPHYPHTFPLNASLYFGFFLGVLPERITAITNLFFVFLLALCVYRLSRQVGSDRVPSVIATCGVLTLPMVALAAGELNSDLGGVALLALAFVFAFAKDIRGHWFLSGLAAGLAFGFKTFHLIPLAFLGVCAFGSAWHGVGPVRQPNASLALRSLEGLRSAAMFGIGALATAGVWLARNWIAYGNPLYPVQPPVVGGLFGWAVDPEVDFAARHFTQFEWVREPWHWLGYPWFEWQQFGQHFKFDAGLGLYFAAAVPAAWLSCFALWLRHGLRRTLPVQQLSLCAVLIVAIWWGMDDRQPRYVLGAQALVMPLTASFLVAQSSESVRVWLERIFVISIIVMLGVAVSKELVNFGDRIILSRQTARSAFYEYPAAIDTLPPGAAVLNLGSRTWHYPLLGANLSNRVISTPRARWLLGLPPSLDRINEVVLRSDVLRQEGVQFVFSESGPVRVDECVTLQKYAEETVNPVNKVPLPSPRVLYRVHYCSG